MSTTQRGRQQEAWKEILKGKKKRGEDKKFEEV